MNRSSPFAYAIHYYQPLSHITMLSWALTFFILAIIAAFFGFAGIAVAAAGIAKILFVIFVALFLGSLVMQFARGADDAVDRNLNG
jgi:uncharacterized membrane protein YtjA (UPF0391 family)